MEKLKIGLLSDRSENAAYFASKNILNICDFYIKIY